MKIGIIGGNGVAATNKLLTLIEEEMTKKGAFKDCHHPELIVWYATKALSDNSNSENFIEEYVEIAKKLKDCGADKICISSSSAYSAMDKISKKADIEIINPVDEIAKEAKKYKKAGLITTDYAIDKKVFKNAFDKICPEVEIIYPDDEFQKMIAKGINNIKDYHRFEPTESQTRPNNIFKKIQEHLKSKGAETIITGSIDIRVDYFERTNIDFAEVLKNLILKEALKSVIKYKDNNNER